MEKFVVALVASLFMIFFAPLLGCLFGAFSGWVVGLFFETTIMGFLARAGFDASTYSLWQVGCAMGFLGGFLKTSRSE